MNEFFTAEDLLKKIKYKRIGIATIYRFLKEKSEKNEIHEYYHERRRVYSATDSSHCHFTCTKCKKSSHFRIKNINFIKKNVKGSICHFQIDVHGTCENCNRK